MTVVYSLTVRNNRLTQVVNAIDGGATNGNMRLTTSGGSILSTFQLSRPCGIVAGGVLSFSGMSIIDPAAVGTGTASAARIDDGDGNIVVSSLTVGTGSTSDVVISPSATITAGQTVALTAASITGN